MKTDPFSVWSWSVGGLGVVGRSGGNAAEVAAFEPVAVALEGDDGGVVDQPVDHGGSDHVVAEDLAPAAERLVGGDDQAGAFVAGGDELEEQVGGLGLEGDVADLVDLCRRRHRSTSSATCPCRPKAPPRYSRSSPSATSRARSR